MNKITKLNLEDRGPGNVEAMLTACEASLGLFLTLHDHVGFFKSAAGLPLIVRRNIHWHPYCQLHRRQSFHHCSDHCKDAVPLQARKQRPFVTRCWKGIREIIIPLHRHGMHVATLYAGAWRANKAPTFPDDVTHQPALKKAHRQLEVLPGTPELENLSPLLATWAEGLMDLCEDLQDLRQAHGNRTEQIRGFLHRHAHQPIRLADLGKELCCSASRAGQLCRELTGKNFQQLLLNERIQRARVLLCASSTSIADIAEACGFGDVYYFSRAFRQRIGCPPGQYRKENGPGHVPV